VLRTAAFELAQEDDLVAQLLDAHMVVLHAGAHLLHFVQLVVVCGEERLGVRRRVVVQVLDHRPGDGNTVVGTRAAADFVQQDDAAVGDVIEDAGRFEHLDHEGRFALRDVVRRPDAREYLVHHTDMRRFGGDEGSHLRHQDDERRLPQQGRLTRHVGAGDHHDLLFLVVEQHVVGDILLPYGHERLDDGMASLADVDALAVVEHGADIAAFAGDAGEGLQAIDTRHDGGVAQQHGERTADAGDDVGIDALFDHQHLLLGAEDLLLVFLQLLGDVAFGIGEGLLADPGLGHLVLMGVAHFDIVAEDVVVADLERRDARRLALALLDACQVILAVERDAAQVVQLGIHAVGDDAALLDLVVERIGVYLPCDAVAHAGHQVDLRRQRMQTVIVRGFERRLEQFDRKERILELHQFPGRHPRRGDTRRNTLHVAHQRHLLAHGVGQVGILDEMPDYVQPFVDLHGILDGHGDPPFEQAAAHGGERAVDDIGEAALLAPPVRREQLEVADREFVDPHVVVLVDTRNRTDMGDVAVLGEFEVVEDGAGGGYAAGEMVDAEPLERRGRELLAEFFTVDLLREDPFVEPVGVMLRPESGGEAVFVTALVDDLLGCEVRNELVDVVVGAFGHVELARRNVEERHTGRLPAEVDRSEESVFLVGQDIVAQHDARGDQFDDAALDQPPHLLGVFQLLADGYALARPHQLGQVGVDGMVGEPRQFDVGCRTVGPPRERNAEYAAGLDRVLAEGFVKIPYPEEQDGIGMHRLDRIILLHQRCLDIFFVYFFLCVHNKKLYVISIQR